MNTTIANLPGTTLMALEIGEAYRAQHVADGDMPIYAVVGELQPDENGKDRVRNLLFVL